MYTKACMDENTLNFILRQKFTITKLHNPKHNITGAKHFRIL